MHKHDLILTISTEGTVTVHRPDKLPFDLRHTMVVGYEQWLNWLKRRFTTVSRTYMNKLYIQRRVGRSNDAIISDSAGISPVDLFWVTRPDLNHTWESLQIMRDAKMSTAMVSLTGELDKSYNIFAEKPEDHISIFTTKGAFPKAIYLQHLLKKGDNAEYEVSAYKLGYELGINVAKSEVVENDIIACELFTTEKKSLVHALELIYPFGENSSDNVHRDAYKLFSKQPEILRDLEKLFIFNYIITNNDLHEENFGFLYCPETFEILSASPAFDFNSAFEVWPSTSIYYQWIYDNLNTFINNNHELVPNLRQVEQFLSTDIYLSEEQKKSIVDRANYVLSLADKQIV